MVRFGEAPYLECSTKGDRRFSAFCAYVGLYGATIESLYQSRKVFSDGATGLTWREAKGRKPVNYEFCKNWYSHLWDCYMWEHPELVAVLRSAAGLSDMFGSPGGVCQAEELWRIRREGISPQVKW